MRAKQAELLDRLRDVNDKVKEVTSELFDLAREIANATSEEDEHMVCGFLLNDEYRDAEAFLTDLSRWQTIDAADVFNAPIVEVNANA